MILLADWQTFTPNTPSDVGKSARLISDIGDIEPVLHTYFQDEAHLTSDMALRDSPIFLLPTSKVLVAVTVGSAESEEFFRR